MEWTCKICGQKFEDDRHQDICESCYQKMEVPPTPVTDEEISKLPVLYLGEREDRAPKMREET